jgi:hypothetical protein
MSGIGARRAWAAERADGRKALYPGICGICSERIKIGDPIVPIRGKYKDGYVHKACGQVDDE